MPNPAWYDDGVRVHLSVSESGDFVALGNRTEYPFAAGGSGIPAGWSMFLSGPAAAGDVNWTTANGRFSVSNISATVSHAGGYYYGIMRDFPVTYGKRYVLWVQARTMENKAGGTWNLTYQFNGTGPAYGIDRATQQDWDQIAIYMLPTDPATTFIRIRLYNNYFVPPGETERFDWGMQWQLPAIVDFESTYPDPVWHDVTCDVQSLSVSYGRSKFTGRFEVASATIGVTNRDGEFTYQTVHPWGLRPGRFVRVQLTRQGNPVTYNAFYGLIDSISDQFPIDGKNVAQLNCIDTSSLLSNQSVPTMSGDKSVSLSGIRFRAILDTIAWNPSKRSWDDGIYYQQGIYQSGRTIRDELGITADSEGAFFWCDRSGNLVYNDRNYLSDTTRTGYVQAELVAECPVFIDEVKFMFPGVNGNGMSLPNEAGFAFSSTIDVSVTCSLDDYASAARQALAGQDGRWEFRKVGGNRNLEFTNSVSFATSTAPLPASIVNGARVSLRCKYDRGAATVTFYYSLPGSGSWTQLGTVVTINGSMPVGTNPVMRIGGNGSTFLFPMRGRVHRVQILSGASTVLDFQPSLFPGQTGATQLSIPATGQQITVSQTGTNVIVQTDTDTKPYRLIPVDNVPTSSSASVVNLKAFETDWSRDRVINDVQIANVGGSAFQAVDHASQQKYGPRTYQRLDFVNDNAHPEYNLERTNDFMEGWTESMLRVNRVTFRPNADTYAWVLTMFLMDLVRVRYQHPTEGWGFAIATHIQGYVHNLTLNGWETSLNLDQPESFVYWQTPPGLGTGWDVDYWDVGIWDNDDPDKSYWSSGEVWSDSGTKWS